MNNTAQQIAMITLTARKKLAEIMAKLPKEYFDIIDGTTIHIPPDPFPYQVLITADNPRRIEGTERWLWLCENLGIFKQDWDVWPAYQSEEPVVYRFKTESDASWFTFVWL